MSKEEFIKLVFGKYGQMTLSKRDTGKVIAGLSKETVDRMRQDAELKSKMIRGQIMFSLDEIYNYIYGEQ